MVDVIHLIIQLSKHITKAKEGNVTEAFVVEVFKDILEFWQYAVEDDKKKYRSHILELTSHFIWLVNQWRGHDLTGENLLVMCEYIKVDNVCEKQCEKISEFYTDYEALFSIELDLFVEVSRYRKLASLRMTPRNMFIYGDCLSILNESTCNKDYNSSQPWINLRNIPEMRNGLPHGPCMATIKGGSDRRKCLQARLKRMSHYTELLKENDMTDYCVICEDKLSSNFAILDCCSHLVCSECKRLNCWKEW